MRKYDGVVVHRTYDEDGILEIVEAGGVRSLHFGSHSRQSSMLLSDPHYLQLSYIRAMTAWLLFSDNPVNVLNVGLGGGSLVKFLLYHFPDCRVEAVEFRRSVARVAYSHFGLQKSERLRIYIGDGADYIRRRARREQDIYDLVLIDAFDHDGLSDSIAGQALFDDCRRILNPEGVLAINLWGSDRTIFNKVALSLNASFEGRMLLLPVKDRGNTIAFAFGEKYVRVALKEIRGRAEWLELRYGIEFPTILKDLYKKNRKTIHQFIYPT
ncbi:MAG: spermine synthase [Gammaproteobacteria bacterium]